jgi:hypothetical protein
MYDRRQLRNRSLVYDSMDAFVGACRAAMGPAPRQVTPTGPGHVTGVQPSRAPLAMVGTRFAMAEEVADGTWTVFNNVTGQAQASGLDRAEAMRQVTALHRHYRRLDRKGDR